MKRLKKLAFTLAEVLVTLGIIGVVAAMTIPTLMNNNQRTVMTTQLRKITTEFELALTKYMSDQRVESLAESQLYNDAANFEDFIQKFFKIKDCSSFSSCFASEYYTISGATGTFSPTCDLIFQLNSGAAVCAQVENVKNTYESGKNNLGMTMDLIRNDVIVLTIDVNGKQGPNVFGRDIFTIHVDELGQFADVYYIQKKTFNQELVDSDNGAYGKIVEDGWKMTY